MVNLNRNKSVQIDILGFKHNSLSKILKIGNIKVGTVKRF